MLCFPAHSSWRHISRGDFQRIPSGATFRAVISRTFFVVPYFTRWFPAYSLWCHIPCGDSQNILCCAIFHAVISSAFFLVPHFTRCFSVLSLRCHFSRCDFQHILSGSTFYTSPNILYNLPVLLIISAFSRIPAPRHSCYLSFSTCRPALCLGVNFNSISYCCTLTSLIVSLVYNAVAPDITNDQCFSLQTAVSVFLS